MNGLALLSVERDEPRRTSATPYERQLRAREEQAFYDRYGKLSTRLPVWKRAVTSVAVAVVAVGTVFLALHGTFGA